METYFCGETVELLASFTDENGDPRNPDSVTCTVLLPDGTTETPTVTNTDVGAYSAMFTPTLNGLHQYRFTGEADPLESAVESAFMAQTDFMEA